MNIKHKNYFLLTLLLIVADQLSKWLSYQYLGLMSQEITGFLSLTFAQNYGAAFSFLANQDGWQRYFLSAISIIASIILTMWLFKTPSKYKFKLIALTLILSGTLGNLIDRVMNGFVVDFIDLHYQNFHWPIFNFADIFITVGVVLLLIVDWKK